MVRRQNLLDVLLFAILLTGLLPGCAPWLLPPLRVLSCSLDNDAGEYVLVCFSVPPQEASLRKAFSLDEDGKNLEGSFSFDREKLWFYPVNGIKSGREYTVTMSTVAEDKQGNSLEKEYRTVFFTKTDREAPLISTVFPGDESTLTEAPAEILFSFSEPVDPLSFDKALQISPAASYIIQWDAAYREASIVPVKPLTMGTRYTLSVSTALQDPSRNSMALPFSSTFLLGDNRAPPHFALTWQNAEETGPLVSGGKNAGLPPDAEFIITFDRDVGIESLAGFLEVQPSLGISISAERDSRVKARIRLTQQPVWGSAYTLIIRKGIAATGGGETEENQMFPLVFDATEFMPPQFLRGFFKNGMVNQAIGDFEFLSLDPLEFPIAGTIPTDICFVFTVSEGSALSPASAMEAFSISVNNTCVYISIKTFRVLDEAAYRGSDFNDPYLEAGNGKDLCALIYGLEVENNNREGLIIFAIDTSLKDLRNNALGADIKITWNKI
jgi:hypothetical protein